MVSSGRLWRTLLSSGAALLSTTSARKVLREGYKDAHGITGVLPAFFALAHADGSHLRLRASKVLRHIDNWAPTRSLRSSARTCGGHQSAQSRLLALRGGARKAVEACLFDFDGTLAQSEDTHRRTFSEILGVELTEEHWNAKCVGSQPRLLLEQNLPPGRLEALNETLDGLLVRRSELFIRYVEQGKLQPTGGAQELIRELRERGIRCAVVSSGERRYIEKALRAMGIEDAIEFIVAGDDEEVEKHKPHPMPYALAAARMNLSPEACLAFEDTITGIRSAQGAGMRVVAMRTSVTQGLRVGDAEADEAAAAPAPSGVDLRSAAGLAPVAALVQDFTEVPRALFVAN